MAVNLWVEGGGQGWTWQGVFARDFGAAVAWFGRRAGSAVVGRILVQTGGVDPYAIH